MTKMHSQALMQLLEEFGLPRPRIVDDAILHSSGPALLETEETYIRANQLLSQELRRGELKQCIHITGVLKALSDPFHRRICRLASQRGREFFLAGYFPEEAVSNGKFVMEWLRTRWISSWTDRLSAFSLIANGDVKVVRLPKHAELHFSLFNFQYVLLQTEDFENKTKFVWLLDNPFLNHKLSEKAEEHKETASPLDAMIFRKELLTICSSSAREMLWILREHGISKASEVDNEALPSLSAAGLVTVDKFAEITSDGRDFLRTWKHE